MTIRSVYVRTLSWGGEKLGVLTVTSPVPSQLKRISDTLLDAQVALLGQGPEIGVAFARAVVQVLRAFERSVGKELRDFRLPESLREPKAPDLRVVIADGGRLYPGVANLRDGTWRTLDLKGSEIARSDGIVGVSGDVFLYKDLADRLMAIGWDPDRLETVGEPIAVPAAPTGLVDATISGNGTLVMSLRSPAYQPVLVDDRGAVVRPLGTAGVGAFYPRLSPDGRTLAVATELRDGAEIELYDLVDGTSRPAGLGH